MEPPPPVGIAGTGDADRLIDQVLDYAIIALDHSGTVTSWNAGAQRLKGYTPAQAIGLSTEAFYPAAERRQGLLRRLLADARRDGRALHTGWRIRQDGSRFWADVLITALRDLDGTLTGFAEITRDVSEGHRVEEEQRSFYAAFAHDFLTPVTALRSYAELLRTDSEGEREGHLARIAELSGRIAAMTRELADHAGRGGHQAAYDPEDLSVDDLISAARGRLRGVLDLWRLDSGLHDVDVRADRLAMERVLANVLGNALKYSTEGPVSVVCERVPGRVHIIVTDEGRGIDPGDLAEVFDEFRRGRLATPDGGSGLGLTSARRLVEQQGGSIMLTSVLAVSTTVTIDLPAATPAAPPAPPAVPPAPPTTPGSGPARPPAPPLAPQLRAA